MHEYNSARCCHFTHCNFCLYFSTLSLSWRAVSFIFFTFYFMPVVVFSSLFPLWFTHSLLFLHLCLLLLVGGLFLRLLFLLLSYWYLLTLQCTDGILTMSLTLFLNAYQRVYRICFLLAQLASLCASLLLLHWARIKFFGIFTAFGISIRLMNLILLTTRLGKF